MTGPEEITFCLLFASYIYTGKVSNQAMEGAIGLAGVTDGYILKIKPSLQTIR